MKKIILSLITVLVLIMMIPYSYAKQNNVKVYMFTKNGCTYCEQAFDFFEKKLKENPDDFELINIEVWCGTDYTTQPNPSWITGNEQALSLMEKVVEHFGQSIEGTPTIVVGDHFQSSAADLDGLYDKITSYKTDKKYTDVVANIAKENNIDIDELNVPHGSANCDILANEDEDSSSVSNRDLVIIAGIFVVLIGGMTGLIIISKK